MGRLYWKIFLGFWLTTVLIVAVTAWSLALLTEEPDGWRGFRDGYRPPWRLARDAAIVELLLESGGLPALRNWLENQGGERGRLWVIDARGRDLLDRSLPAPLVEAMGGQGQMWTVRGPDGSAYRIWRAPFSRSLLPRHPELFGLGLLVAVTLSGLVCWLLARYLTRPVRHLQAATRRLAQGDLAVRVVPGIGRRRDEIADLGADFDRMAERLERLLSAQRQLLRDISHELRSPLARMQVALELARKRGQGAERELDRIGREARRLEILIDQLLSLQRLESGNLVPARESVNLDQLLESVARDAGFEANHRQRRVSVIHAVPCVLSGDRDLLRSALDNIVRNAIQHTDPDTTVELSLTAERDAALIRVRDRGPGVPEADLPKLFEPFFRIEAARDRSTGGYGLGLAIAVQAVRVHGGDIEAVNAPDGGLEVRIHLPLSPPAAE